MTGQPSHPDADVLAEFRAGLVTGRRAAMITAHLAGCARCTGLADELAGVSALLAAVPAPAMPDRVTQRLDTVLAAEVAHRSDSERARGNRPHDAATRRRWAGSGGFRRISLRVLTPAAAVLLVAAGGYALSHHGSSPQMLGISAGPASRAASAPLLAPAFPKAAGTAAAGTSPRSHRMPAADLTTIVISPVDFQAATLTPQLEADLRVPVTARTTHAASAGVRACVQRVSGRAAVLRIESAHFAGQPVTVVVTRTVTRTGQAGDEVQLAGPGCSATSSHVLATAIVPPGIS
ncbi:MAG: hypothetical protein M3Z75_07805 [Actinomycetota bacterium]|nr:hypothetical protein [Actinomycetota bacterium]